MPKTAPNPIMAAAYHEAGHAVMCHLLHLRIRSVGIDADELVGGETTHDNPPLGRASPADGSGRSRMEKIVMLCLAGPLAQRKFTRGGSQEDDGGAIDAETASGLATRFFRSRKTAEAYIAFARAWVWQKFEEPRIWAAVERLARALIERRRLSGRQAEAIIRGASPRRSDARQVGAR
ncbi:MAG TPA: hypothetical protein VN766_14955 [Stellaceae bacterium]|jgi:hypothetical protein|nr:hypothetical protein [Stellaceae bacterium]